MWQNNMLYQNIIGIHYYIYFLLCSRENPKPVLVNGQNSVKLVLVDLCTHYTVHVFLFPTCTGEYLCSPSTTVITPIS